MQFSNIKPSLPVLPIGWRTAVRALPLALLAFPFLSIRVLSVYGPALGLYLLAQCEPPYDPEKRSRWYGFSQWAFGILKWGSWCGFLWFIVPIQTARPFWTSWLILASLIHFWFIKQKLAKPLIDWFASAFCSGIVLMGAAQESRFFLVAWVSFFFLVGLSENQRNYLKQQLKEVRVLRWACALWIVALFGSAWFYFGYYILAKAMNRLHVGWPRHIAAAFFGFAPLLLLTLFWSLKDKLLQRVILACAGLTVSIISAEMLLRCCGPISYGFHGDAIQVDLADRIYHQNSAGFRDQDHNLKKPAGTYRIITLGDSITFGAGVEFENIYPIKLAHKLNQNSSTRIEVINISRSGWNTRNELKALESNGYKYAPDLVILGFVLNDAENRDDIYSEPTLLPGLYELSLRWSYSYSLTRYIYNRLDQMLTSQRNYKEYVEGIFAPDRPGWLDCKASLKSMAEGLRKKDIRFIVVIFPMLMDFQSYSFEEVHKRLANWASECGAEVIDLLPIYQNFDQKVLQVSFADGHPNAKGHDLATEAIYNHLHGIWPLK